ncbi:MAG: alpha/beta fold hydrolase [Candidatus Heimdallarchaeaceae archaeon]|jgi:hypothetical protein
MNLSAEERFTKFERAKYEKEASEKYLIMSDGSELRILQTSAPEKTREDFALLIIPGWGSVVQGWDDVLLAAIPYFDIVYFESREKGSSKLAKKARCDLERLSSDIKEVIEQLNLKKEKLIIFSSSFGSLQVAHGLALNKFEAFLPVLVGAEARIDLPSFTRFLIPWFPPFLLNMFMPLAKFWIKKFKSEDAVQAAKYIRVFEEADARKWQKVGRYVVFKWFWDVYEQVEDRVLLIGMEEDKYHELDQIKEISKLMKNSYYLDMRTNSNTHSDKMVDVLREQIKE